MRNLATARGTKPKNKLEVCVRVCGSVLGGATTQKYYRHFLVTTGHFSYGQHIIHDRSPLIEADRNRLLPRAAIPLKLRRVPLPQSMYRASFGVPAV